MKRFFLPLLLALAATASARAQAPPSLVWITNSSVKLEQIITLCAIAIALLLASNQFGMTDVPDITDEMPRHQRAADFGWFCRQSLDRLFRSGPKPAATDSGCHLAGAREIVRAALKHHKEKNGL